MSDHVYMVWDFYDGVRSGIAEYSGAPHYFECIFDNQEQEYSDTFILKPIDQETLFEAKEQWSIYKAWEARFHGGSEPLETHPGHGGVNLRYDELERLLKDKLKAIPVAASAVGTFQARKDQPVLPESRLLEMEVDWD